MSERHEQNTGLPGRDFDALGIRDMDRYAARNCAGTGGDDGIPGRDFCSAFNFFRLAAILQVIVGRVRDGTAASRHASTAAAAAGPLADLGWQYARRN